ncbi:MAG: 1-deoxy-D-xylulose-5-phosphate reductoisomerase [Bacteroidota bacterium]
MSIPPKNKKRVVAILGSTGSIGTQALDVIAAHPDFFELELITANGNTALLIEQAKKYLPATVVICDKEKYNEVKTALASLPIKVFAGSEAINQCVQNENIEVVLTAMVGFAGLAPTIAAIKSGKHIALANKETLVVAGEIITQLAKENGVNIYPVDSEHSAIFQCLLGEWNNRIEKIILTASGGPFRGKTIDELKQITKAQALKHPNWNMGAKITIDSATLMNKGLEVIEAKWLFGVTPEQIEVIVHPQSIIHSIVQFEDGSMKAQMGLPDMKLPIQFALGYPNRLKSDFPRFNFINYSSFTFELPDKKTFRSLALAYDALSKGGNMPCILNAANEIAVAGFLAEKISFLNMTDLVETCMRKMPFIASPSIEDYIHSNEETRRTAKALIASGF